MKIAAPPPWDWILTCSAPLAPPINVETPLTDKPPEVALKPFPAVIIPIESTFVTSSYVNVPPIDTLWSKVAIPVTSKLFVDVTPVTFKVSRSIVSWMEVTFPNIWFAVSIPTARTFVLFSRADSIFYAVGFVVPIPTSPDATILVTSSWL